MRLLFFSTKSYEQALFTEQLDSSRHSFTFLEPRLTLETVPLVTEAEAVCVFVNDELNEKVLAELAERGVRLVLLRCAGFNQVDLVAAERLGLQVARVPEYSPHAVAEHTLALMLSLNRRTHRAYLRTREFNFNLAGLMGFDLYGKRVGIVGFGKIGCCVARIMQGLGCDVRVHDPFAAEPAPEGIRFSELAPLLETSDVITLHCPLNPDTHHLIDGAAFAQMKPGVMLINTSRGGLVDAKAAIAALKSGKLGYLGLDVYEEEADLFFQDLSDRVIPDDVFARLMTFPNVLITAHQAFFTREAMARIVSTTLANLDGFERGAVPQENLVTACRRQGS
ncbi:2-hydroxyacid dehydrogenase [Sulfidibacter corallicola]|uniref:2-hydroxyacid dehydrogenase n=1 Tax=Sulfidibacter corallicola TaxID=2818388 RepID=A0A8A4TXB5_SULCO|nr:2-hydroxyacid dehydrogenase [Sulfidibacter corallicola]QTD53612.1 2-hydroxyacid dehydrogenase [Sulfidibacter corallicola]